MRGCNKVLLGGAFIVSGCIVAIKTYSMKNNSLHSVVKGQKNMALITRPSGLSFQILDHGTGETTPKPGQRVSVHYTGWLDEGNGIPGKKFDSSVDRGAPFTFVIGRNQVIKGWDEGLLEMKVGEKRRLIIPSALGYGPSGYPGAIPGNATLIFDVELLEIK